ncbi:MAG: DoxX family protein [Cyclobacteriaceae bacterium]
MVNANSQSPGVWYDGVALVRIMVGIMLIFRGWGLFENQELSDVSDLLFNMSIPFQEAMSFTTKLVELTGGFFLILGLFTRLMTALLFISFMFLSFVMGEGKVFAENQLSFLFGLMSLSFFFTGAGRFSIDYILFVNRKDDHTDSNLSVSKRFGRYVSKS